MKTNFLSSSKFKITIDKKQLLKEIVANNSRTTNQLVKEYIEPRINIKEKINQIYTNRLIYKFDNKYKRKNKNVDI